MEKGRASRTAASPAQLAILLPAQAHGDVKMTSPVGRAAAAAATTPASRNGEPGRARTCFRRARTRLNAGSRNLAAPPPVGRRRAVGGAQTRRSTAEHGVGDSGEPAASRDAMSG